MSSESPSGSDTTTYAFDNAGSQAPQRFGALETLYDAWTTRHLDACGVTAGWHCLEVGGGAGSIAHWLARRVGPTGHVLVTDIDPRFLLPLAGPTLEVRRHDIATEALPEAAFDLIHARLVLSHLPARAQALDRMVAALKPRGWLVLEDFDWCSQLPDPTNAAAAALYTKVQHAVWQVMTAHGAVGTYGRQLFGQLQTRGLVAVGAAGSVSMYQGGAPGAQLLRAAVEQLHEPIVQSALMTEPEIAAALALLADPDFAVMSPVMMTAWGQRPPQ